MPPLLLQTRPISQVTVPLLIDATERHEVRVNAKHRPFCYRCTVLADQSDSPINVIRRRGLRAIGEQSVESAGVLKALLPESCTSSCSSIVYRPSCAVSSSHPDVCLARLEEYRPAPMIGTSRIRNRP